MRPRFCAFLACSLDGFIARPDGGLDWLGPFEKSGEDYGYRAFFEAIDTVVLGRGTYDTVLGFQAWPYAGKRVVVLTHRPAVARAEERFHAGELEPLVQSLEREGAKEVYVDGGKTISAFISAGLLDRLTLSVAPVLLGAGLPLFSVRAPDRRLELRSHRAFPSGLVQLEYALRAG